MQSFQLEMNVMKYEDAYCELENDNFSIDEVTAIFCENPSRFAKRFEGHMLCPGCHKVMLSFVNAQSPHFRGYANMDHDPGCDFQKGEMPEAEVIALASSHARRSEIENQMNRLLIQLIGKSEGVETSTSIKLPAISPEHPSVKRRRQTNTIIPRKQLNAPFSDDDYGKMKLFYGKVHIEWEKVRNENKWKLLVRAIATRRLICRLFLTQIVFQYLPGEYFQESEYDAHIIFFASLNRISDDKSWSQGQIQRSSFLKIESA